MDDQSKAKALMAAGLFILAAIGLVVVLVVLPAIQGGSGAPNAIAQGGPPMSPGAGGGGPMMGPAPGGMPGGAMPGMPMGGGGMGGAPGMGAPEATSGTQAAPAKVLEPLEPSRKNPFAPMGAIVGVTEKRVRRGLAFRPSYRGMPIGLREQNRYPAVGPSGETIRVPSGAPSVATTGPQLPPGEEFLRVTAIMRDAQGRAMVVLQGAPGQPGTVLQVGDLYQGARVEKITNTEMVLVKEEDGTTVRRTIRLQVGAAGRRPGGPQSGPGRPGVTVPGARQPGGAQPGAAPGQPPAGGRQPGIRRPGGAQPGGFPGAGGGQ